MLLDPGLGPTEQHRSRLDRGVRVSQGHHQTIAAQHPFDQQSNIPGLETDVAFWKLWNEPGMLVHAGARAVCQDEVDFCIPVATHLAPRTTFIPSHPDSCT